MNGYCRADLYEGLSRLGINRGDLLFIHSNIGFFGRCEDVSPTEVCNIFYYAVRQHIGEDGTIVVPAFTYSYPRGETFDKWAPSRMGAFAEFVRRHPKAMRSEDPCYSVAAVGSLAPHMMAFDGNSFSDNSFFAKFCEHKGKILNFNFDAGSTFVHYFERQESVPYRFDKGFHGETFLGDGRIPDYCTIYVRYLHPDLEADFTVFDQLARKHSMYRTVKLGRGEMGVITVDDTRLLIKATLPLRPWFLTKAEISGVSLAPEEYSFLQ